MLSIHIGIASLTFHTQLRNGRTAHIIQRFDVESCLEVHATFQVTDLLIVPPIVDAIVMSGLADPKDQNYREECSLRSVQYGIDNTLQNVDNLRIEWINTLNLHLQLDVRERVLRLFRFPSFSWLLHQGHIVRGWWPVTSFLFPDVRRSQHWSQEIPAEGWPDDQGVAFSERCRKSCSRTDSSLRLTAARATRSTQRKGASGKLTSPMMGVPDASTNSIRFFNYGAQFLPELQSVLGRFGGQETDASVGYAPNIFLS
jgi:hypothetical protein